MIRIVVASSKVIIKYRLRWEVQLHQKTPSSHIKLSSVNYPRQLCDFLLNFKSQSSIVKKFNLRLDETKKRETP